MIYILIFFSKICENALSTLRLIVVASGKKVFGAILLLCITLIWISITGIVISNINKDPFMIIVFSVGSLFGSYLGSILEEKIALGYNLIVYKGNYNFLNILNNYHIKYNVIKNNNNEDIFLIIIPRRHKKHILHLIKEYDSNATILSEIININQSGT